MEKLKFNVAKNEWTVEKSSTSFHPDDIRNIHPWIELFQAGDCFYFVTVPKSNSIVFCSKGSDALLGYQRHEIDMEFLFNAIHPDDLPVAEEFEDEAAAFYNSLSAEESLNYKVQYNLRLKTKWGNYKHIMFQYQPYRVNDEEEVEYLYVFTDITSFKSNADQYLSLVHLKGGPSKKIYRSNKKVEALPDFSNRELQILEATVREGDVERAAQALHLSVKTVRNHILRIRKKAGAKSTVHLLALVKEKNWLK